MKVTDRFVLISNDKETEERSRNRYGEHFNDIIKSTGFVYGKRFVKNKDMDNIYFINGLCMIQDNNQSHIGIRYYNVNNLFVLQDALTEYTEKLEDMIKQNYELIDLDQEDFYDTQ